MLKLTEHANVLNQRLRKANVKNGNGEAWLNKNIPDWKTSVDGRVSVMDTRFGYPKVFPKFRTSSDLPERLERAAEKMGIKPLRRNT
jgi:hypothetical protein